MFTYGQCKRGAESDDEGLRIEGSLLEHKWSTELTSKVVRYLAITVCNVDLRGIRATVKPSLLGRAMEALPRFGFAASVS
jgi:hypothetical protein